MYLVCRTYNILHVEYNKDQLGRWRFHDVHSLHVLALVYLIPVGTWSPSRLLRISTTTVMFTLRILLLLFF
ncbi:hypothetical protein BDV24DRAFT_136671 [Aspergillus arachidicola]|uniref:Uncharacterized protein n=1 Tax=Aspergillus arachidicola TaxID=656916 RepID=A0A5N6Y5T3_9EURO|nr:hypothetical protein BDV24DRAFT_136671 [Aspergillus arachidicola]